MLQLKTVTRSRTILNDGDDVLQLVAGHVESERLPQQPMESESLKSQQRMPGENSLSLKHRPVLLHVSILDWSLDREVRVPTGGETLL